MDIDVDMVWTWTVVEKELHSFSMEISKTEIVSFNPQNNPER